MQERPAVEGDFDFEVPAFVRRGRDPGAEDGLGRLQDESFEEPEPPYRAAQQEARAAEQELERRASGGHTADEAPGCDGKPLRVGDVATVLFGAGKHAYPKTGTLLAIEAEMARVRLNGSKEPLGDAFPHSRVSAGPINGGKPLKSKGEKKTAAEHALHLKEYKDAVAEGRKPRPSDGFAHAHAAADDAVPLPKRVLKGHNTQVSEATLYRHLGAVRAAQEVVESASGKLRERLKKAKDDGVDVKILRKIMGELKLSTDEVVSEINATNAYRAAFHLPNHAPLDTFDDDDRDDPTKREAYAKEQGLLAGFRGAEEGSNPYPDLADACHLAWAAGHREAQNRLQLRNIKQL
jgi:uncharacterized protein (UPF0335 family)